MVLKEDTAWAKAGHEIAYGQEVIDITMKNDLEENELKVVDGDGNIGIYVGKTEVLFSKDKGLVSLVYDKKELIIERPQPVFWRASTDNDKGYAHNHNCSAWLGASLFQKMKHIAQFKIAEDKKSVEIFYIHEIPVVPELEVNVTYLVKNTGDIKVTLKYNGKEGLPELPLLGMRFKMPNDFNTFKYFGKGPEENYIDRNKGARVDIFERSVVSNLTPYLVPQECGNRTEVRWAEVKTEDNKGVKFIYDNNPFELSVLPYNFLELEQAAHEYELPKSNYTYVTISMKQMGVGGDDSWGAPVLDEFCIPSNKNYEYSFYIRNINGNK